MEEKRIQILEGIKCVENMASSYVGASIPDACLKQCLVASDAAVEDVPYDVLVGESNDEAVLKRNANFMSKLLDLREGTRKVGVGRYRLGNYCGREAFYCTNPAEGFYNTHKAHALMITPNENSVPRDWVGLNGCLAVTPEEAFYPEDGKICVSDVLTRLKSKGNKTAKTVKTSSRGVRSRVSRWGATFEVIYDNDYDPKNYKKGMMKHTAAADWYNSVNKKHPISAKTVGRDIEHLVSYYKGKDKGTPQERFLGGIWLKIGDPSLTNEQRQSKVEKIKSAMLTLAEDPIYGGFAQDDIASTETGFETGADGRSNCVRTTSGESVYAQIA